jgi:hypothetical protein
MEEILKILKDGTVRSTPLILILIVFGYFGKLYVENQFDAVNNRVQSISASSLSIKESLRQRELDALLALRDSIEDWEH